VCLASRGGATQDIPFIILKVSQGETNPMATLKLIAAIKVTSVSNTSLSFSR